MATISLAIVSLSNWKKSIYVLIPYVSLVICFAGFVVWNGGVVLGKWNFVLCLLVAVPKLFWAV